MDRKIEPSASVVRRSFRIRASSAPWLTLHLHAVTPGERAARAVLLLHGATLSGYVFDPPAPAPSWQARLAARGWATYALDARGFGNSTRPAPGDHGFDDSRPFGRAADGVADVADAMRFIREQRGHAVVALVGFSWGTILAGCFAAAHPDSASRLTLAIVAINGWNRLAVAFRTPPGTYQPSARAAPAAPLQADSR
jgi:pimeloyl-ACP methyl ester carboxylesterase